MTGSSLPIEDRPVLPGYEVWADEWPCECFRHDCPHSLRHLVVADAALGRYPDAALGVTEFGQIAVRDVDGRRTLPHLAWPPEPGQHHPSEMA